MEEKKDRNLQALLQQDGMLYDLDLVVLMSPQPS